MLAELSRRWTTRAAFLAGVALIPVMQAQATEPVDVEQLQRQLETLMQELQEIKARQKQQQETIESQNRQIEEQQKTLQSQDERIDTQEEVTAAPAQVVTAGDHPGSFKLPGTDTSVKIGGYVKADFFYDVNSDTGDSFAVSAIPADGTDEEEGSFRAHARQTRLNLTTWTPTDAIGEIKTFIEGDFFGAGGNEVFSNSTLFRIRHAYGQISQDDLSLLFGQTWTNFMPLASYPETIDFFGPAGIPFVRQGQARLTYTGFENFSLSASVENSELTARDGTIEDSSDIRSEAGLEFGIDTLPDFTGAVEYSRDGWSAKLAGVARLLETDTGGGAPSDEQEFAWGVFAGAVVPTFGEDTFQLNFAYGDGIGRYILNGFGQDAFVDPATGSLETIEAWGAAIGYTHHWADTLRSNLVYGHYEVEDTFGADDTERLQSFHVNLIWSPVERINLGVEGMYGIRSFEDDDLDNDALRFQFAAQYIF